MDKSEFERMKEEEKQHLREIMGLKKKLGEAQRKAGILGALNNMGVSDESEATYNEMLGKLNQSNWESQARMEIALENSGISPVSAPTASVAPQTPVMSEEEMQKLRAAELVKQMKLEFGGPMMPLTDTSSAAPLDMGLDRTIGRMPKPTIDESTTDEAASTSAPDRTIGKAVKRGI